MKARTGNEVRQYVDQLKNYSTTNISSIQKGLVPEVVDISWKVMNYYVSNGIRKYVTYEKEGYVLKVVGVRYRSTVLSPKTNNFDKRMTDAVDEGLVYPFMLFVDGYHVKWSTFRIVRNSKYTYIVCDNDTVEGIDPMHIHKVEIVNLPYTYMSYSEKRKIGKDYEELFRFDNDGKLSDVGPIVYSLDINKLNIVYKKLKVLNGGRLLNHNLEINDKFKLTKNNTLCWKDGLFDKDLDPEIKNLNILTVENGDPLQYDLIMKIFYRDVTNHNISNITIPDNKGLLKSLIIEEENDMPAMDIVALGRDFDFKYRWNTEYDDNVDAGIRYISRYNSQLFNELYEKRLRIHSKEYFWDELKANIHNNVFTMPRGYHRHPETYVMIFKDGELWDKYHRIRYVSNNFEIPLTDDEISAIDDSYLFEIVYFSGVNNNFLTVECTENNNTIENTTIKFDDLMVFANYTEDHIYKTIPFNKRTIFDVDYEVNKETKVVTFTNPKYHGKTLYMAAKNQFKYNYFLVNEPKVRFFVDRTFIPALNKDRYMVFHNGRLLTKDMYMVVTPDEDSAATQICVHIRRVAKKGDRVEIFYIPYDFSNTAIGKSNQVDVVSVRATVDRQPVFGIPFPTKSYNLTKDNFLLLRGSVLVDQSRYNVVGRKLIFIDPEDYVDHGRELTFIFLYNKNIDVNPYGGVQEDQLLKVQPEYTFADTENQTTFEIPYPKGDPEGFNGYFFVTYRGLYVNPKRYTISPNKTKIKFNEKTGIDPSTAVIFVFVYNEDKRKINYSAVGVRATLDNQLKFQIPVPYAKYLEEENSFFVIRNGVFLNDDEYYVDTKAKTLDLLTTQGLYVGQELVFNFMVGKDLSIKTAIEEVRAEEDKQKVFKLPIPLRDYENKNGKFFCVIGDTYIDNRRFEIIGNDLRFLNTEDAILEGRIISFIFVYTEEIDSEAATIGKVVNTSKLSTFVTKSVECTENGQRRFEIPWKDSMLMDKKIIVNVGSTFLRDDQYSIGKASNTITLLDDGVITSTDRQVTFTLIDSDYVVIQKENITVDAVVNAQMNFNIPLPYDNYLKQGNSVLVFRNQTFISPERYTIDTNAATITFKNYEDAVNKGRSISFLYLYIANASNKTNSREDVNHPMINERGYLYLNRSDLGHAMFNKSYFMFVNGKKINRDNIMNIANNIIRLKNDIQTRFNTFILDYTPEIEELARYKNINSDYDIIMNQVTNEDINRLFNVYTNITDLEGHIVPDTSKEAIINDIIRAHYLANNVNNGLPFIYAYDTSTFTNRSKYEMVTTTHRYIDAGKYTLNIPHGVDMIEVKTIASAAYIAPVSRAVDSLGYFREEDYTLGQVSFVLPANVADTIEKHTHFRELNIASIPYKSIPTENALNDPKFVPGFLPKRDNDTNMTYGRNYRKSFYQRLIIKTMKVVPGMKYKLTIPENGFINIAYSASESQNFLDEFYRFKIEFDSDRHSTVIVYKGDGNTEADDLYTDFKEIYSDISSISLDNRQLYITKGTHYWIAPDNVGEIIVTICSGYSGTGKDIVRRITAMQFCGYNELEFAVPSIPAIPSIDTVPMSEFYDRKNDKYDHTRFDSFRGGHQLTMESDGTVFGAGLENIEFYNPSDASKISAQINISQFIANGVKASISTTSPSNEVSTFISVRELENYTVIVASPQFNFYKTQARPSKNQLLNGAVGIIVKNKDESLDDSDSSMYISNVLIADNTENPKIDHHINEEDKDVRFDPDFHNAQNEEALLEKDRPVFEKPLPQLNYETNSEKYNKDKVIKHTSND